MNHLEFSSEFDILYNNIMSNTAPGLDEYEKSVFLTQAQEQLIVQYYSGEPYGSFEETELIRKILDELVYTFTTSSKLPNLLGLSPNSVFFKIPDDAWFITYEKVKLSDESLCGDKEAIVIPTRQDEFYKIQNNPFKGPNEHRVLRLDVNGNTKELISKYNITEYLIRYLVKPTPIILIDLEDGLTINGLDTITECNLNPVIHRTLLNLAVKLAKIAYTGN